MVHFSQISLRFLFLASLAFLQMSCLQTSLIYNLNTFHDGRTLGKGRGSGQAFLSEAVQLETTKDDGFKTEVHKWLTAGIGGRMGISNQLDLGGQVVTGLGRYAGRLYVKTRLNSPNNRLAVAVMPALGFSIGDQDDDDDTGSELSSHMYTLELHAPLSYDSSPRFRWIFGGHIYYFLYRAPFRPGPAESPLFPKQTVRQSYICPALSAGFQYGPLTPEFTVALIDGEARAFGGIGFNF